MKSTIFMRFYLFLARKFLSEASKPPEATHGVGTSAFLEMNVYCAAIRMLLSKKVI